MFKFLRKKGSKMDWTQFLSGIPARDYIFQQIPYKEQIEEAAQMIKEADHILLGAGAGLSTAAGMSYGGQRFQDNFSDFIDRFGIRDMYSAGFYPYPSEETRWGYWARQTVLNRINVSATPLYQQLFEMIKEKDYFVLTTNVDAQFEKAGFAKDRIFATQGDYGYIQCAKGCHDKIYDAMQLFLDMNASIKNCEIPTDLVPKCPVCGGPMAMNLRADQYFVEDEAWHEAAAQYGSFLKSNLDREKVLLLELGVGFNTPTIVRFPFEKMMREHLQLKMVRLNLDEAVIPESFGKRAVGINDDMARSITDIKQELQKGR